MSGAAPSGSGTVVGRYVLYDEIAAGGMATIHIGRLLAEVGSFSHTVAIKRLLPQFSKDAEFRQMFLEEARLAARIRHANVVQVLDVVSTVEELFLVMEFIQGETITRLTRVDRKRSRIVPMPIALAIMVDALQGLHAAHEAKDEMGRPLEIVHRDISPHNIMVGHDGRARVLDFGIAKASSSSQSTREGEVKGKFAYMSPEQLSSATVDRRADLFAASIVLWEMLSARRLFQAPDPAAIVGRVLNGVIQKPSEVAQGLPMLLDAIVMKGLDRDPKKRFQTAAEFAKAIETSGLPIARPTEVGAWVNRIAGDTLKKRARRVAEIESTGSWSASNALAASQALSQRDLTGSGSASQSRSAIRPRGSADLSSSVPVALPSDIIIETDASGSQQLPAFLDDEAPKKKSRVGLVAFLFLLAIGGAAGVFIWRSGGVAGARERIAKLTHVEPHGQLVGSQAPSANAATATASATSTAPIAAGDAVDLSSSPGTTNTGGSTTTTTTTQTGRTRRGGGTNVDPRIQNRAPNGNAGGSGGDLNEAMQNASGGGIGVGQNAVTAQTAQNNGALPTRPSLGQVHAAVGQVMGSARACFNPDDPPSRANVTFQSDGSVKSITVTGFAAGKSQEACVKGMLGKAHLSPFSDPTYSVPVPINP
jgi:serine/threonine-protein kinase